MQPFGEAGVRHQSGLIDMFTIFVGEEDLVLLHLNDAHIPLIGHIHERPVVSLDDAALHQARHREKV